MFRQGKGRPISSRPLPARASEKQCRKLLAAAIPDSPGDADKVFEAPSLTNKRIGLMKHADIGHNFFLKGFPGTRVDHKTAGWRGNCFNVLGHSCLKRSNDFLSVRPSRLAIIPALMPEMFFLPPRRCGRKLGHQPFWKGFQ